MASSRAEEVAELLFELKRADKVAVYSVIAGQAGFSAGTNGRAMLTALKTVRRDWPHLQWFRAVDDSLAVEKDSEQAQLLSDVGIELVEAEDEGFVVLADAEACLMTWGTESEEAEEAAQAEE